MADTKPFVHGSEGTHYSCNERSPMACCECQPHKGCKLGLAPSEITQIRSRDYRLQPCGCRWEDDKQVDWCAVHQTSEPTVADSQPLEEK